MIARRPDRQAAAVPYTMRLADGRTVYIEIPEKWTAVDRDGSIAFLPPAVRLLDRVRSLAMRIDRPPTPGFVISLRNALGLTQQQFAGRLGVNKLTVSRWERGAVRPGSGSIAAMRRLRAASIRRGVAIPT